MSLKRKLKEQYVSELHGKFEKIKVAIITNYCGLSVDEMNILRRKLRNDLAEYKVVKNSIVKRAAKDTELELLNGFFTGPTGIAFSYEDPITPAKVITSFIKDYPKLEIKAGVLDGKVMTKEDINLLTTIPSREVLLAQVLSLLNSAQTGLVRVLNGIPTKFLHVLQGIKEKKA